MQSHAAQPKPNPTSAACSRHGDVFLVVGLFGTVLLMILPIHPFFLDGFLAVSIALSLLILLSILYVKEPAEFTGFPTLLLFITLYRLSLNIASTRLILLDGYAGHIIETFGNFVVRGNYVVGLVIFLILALINFIVITKGAGRIAEVAARFTLDAMPGKQMAIDAELNAGIINEAEARHRRRKVEQEADFYGAMDGASKFVRGDAIAAILDHPDQCAGRVCHRHHAKGHDRQRGLAALHPALHRRRFGLANSRRSSPPPPPASSSPAPPPRRNWARN